MAAGSVLKKITTRAKQIYARGGTWTGAIKKAGAEYRGGSKKKTHKRKTKRTRVSGVASTFATAMIGKASTRRKKAVRAAKKYHAKEGRALAKLGSVSAHMSHAKKILENQIGIAETGKFKATKKAAKRKIGKRIAALKSKYRKLC